MNFWRHRRVLITGANGYLGTELAKTLIEKGALVFGFDASAQGGISNLGLDKEVKLIVGSLRDLELVEKVLTENEIQTCFHLAGQSGVSASQELPLLAFESNIMATWVLLEACRRYNQVSQIVVASSNHIYGEQDVMPTSEDLPLKGLGTYGVSKACADMIARCYAKTYSLPVTIARITNTYGGFDPHKDHIITNTIISVLKNESPIIKSDGKSEKGYLHIVDTVNAFLTLAEKMSVVDIKGEAFNFYPDESISVLDLVRKIIQVSGKTHIEPMTLGKPRKENEIDREHLSNQKAKRLLGWQPKHSLEVGLRQTIGLYSKT